MVVVVNVAVLLTIVEVDVNVMEAVATPLTALAECTVFNVPSGIKITLLIGVVFKPLDVDAISLRELITVILDRSIVRPEFEINFAVVLLFNVTFSNTVTKYF